MYEVLIFPLVEFEFMQRALLGMLLVSLSATPVGVFLMLRRMSLTGDAMAHAILPGVAVAFLLSGLSVIAMTVGGLIAGALVVLFSGLTSRKTNTGEDANLAAFYLVSLSIGVMIISMAGGTVDLLHILFGSTLALDNTAVIILYTICALTLLTLSVIYRPLILESIDPDYLRSVSRVGAFAVYSFLVLMVLNLVGGFHAMGTLMSVGMMILPAATARFWVGQLEPMLLMAMALAFSSGYTGLIVSYHISVPTSPAIIIVLGVCYLISVLFGSRNGIVTALLVRQRKHLTA